MAAQILALPCLGFDMALGNDESWVDAWAYVDAANVPLDLAAFVSAGGHVNFFVRSQDSKRILMALASTATTVDGLPVNGRVRVGGAGGNVVALRIERDVMQRVPAGTYDFEMQAVSAGPVLTIALGRVTIRQGLRR